MRPPAFFLLAPLLFGCGDGPTPGGIDVDEDGWTVGEGDCDDGDAAVHPGASEVVADGVD